MPRVLVCTVGAWSNSVGSNTMSELFREYDKNKIACLYIRADISDSFSCHRYFHIYEGRVLNSVFNHKLITGEEYTLGEGCQSLDDLVEEKARYSFFRRRSNWLFLFVREFIWKLGHWKSRELDSFLDSFNPEVLVCPIESYIHFNRITEYIFCKKHPRLIGFLWDDNFTYKQHPYNIGYRIHRFWLRQGVKRLVKQCEAVVALSPKMKEEADKFFSINTQLLTKPIFNQQPFVHYMPSVPLRILYTGNLYVGRDETLAAIVDAIREVNYEKHKVILDVFTPTKIKPSLEGRVMVKDCCVVHNPILQSEVLKLQQQYDVLLFIESLNSSDFGAARLSFSTKITDYFCAGKCIWAVGNSHLSAIDYLQRQDAAICSLTRESIKTTLELLVSTPDLICQYAYKGWQCGHEKHASEVITEKLYEILCPK